jgi:hypothetical protein
MGTWAFIILVSHFCEYSFSIIKILRLKMKNVEMCKVAEIQ